MTETKVVKKKDCLHFEVCEWVGSGCSNWKEDPCAYYEKDNLHDKENGSDG
jgi:hypothetical protein